MGFFIDMDVGPVSSPNYANNNYSCYFDSLMTAYIHNPIDRGSTPLGITVIATPKPLSQIDFIYQWFNFTTRPIPNQDDSTLYSWMSGEPFPNNLIATCESPTAPSDTRFLLSFGPFDDFLPGDTLNVSIALVGGEGVEDGPNNLKEQRRAGDQALQARVRPADHPAVPVAHPRRGPPERHAATGVRAPDRSIRSRRGTIPTSSPGRSRPTTGGGSIPPATREA